VKCSKPFSRGTSSINALYFSTCEYVPSCACIVNLLSQSRLGDEAWILNDKAWWGKMLPRKVKNECLGLVCRPKTIVESLNLAAAITNEWTNEWLNEWTTERLNDWMNDWTNERLNDWTNEGWHPSECDGKRLRLTLQLQSLRSHVVATRTNEPLNKSKLS